jgi:hypothetical protein
LRIGGASRGPVHQGQAVVRDRGERFQLRSALEVRLGSAGGALTQRLADSASLCVIGLEPGARSSASMRSQVRCAQGDLPSWLGSVERVIGQAAGIPFHLFLVGGCGRVQRLSSKQAGNRGSILMASR